VAEGKGNDHARVRKGRVRSSIGRCTQGEAYLATKLLYLLLGARAEAVLGREALVRLRADA
jgi:hypothetical protein